VEEMRARELANCTIDVLANTFPADIEVPDIEDRERPDHGHSSELEQYERPALHEPGHGGGGGGGLCYEGQYSARSAHSEYSTASEDEVVGALRLAAEVAEERRCQRYFDDKAGAYTRSHFRST